jgi:hypothetical protein
MARIIRRRELLYHTNIQCSCGFITKNGRPGWAAVFGSSLPFKAELRPQAASQVIVSALAEIEIVANLGPYPDGAGKSLKAAGDKYAERSRPRLEFRTPKTMQGSKSPIPPFGGDTIREGLPPPEAIRRFRLHLNTGANVDRCTPTTNADLARLSDLVI